MNSHLQSKKNKSKTGLVGMKKIKKAEEDEDYFSPLKARTSNTTSLDNEFANLDLEKRSASEAINILFKDKIPDSPFITNNERREDNLANIVNIIEDRNEENTDRFIPRDIEKIYLKHDKYLKEEKDKEDKEYKEYKEGLKDKEVKEDLEVKEGHKDKECIEESDKSSYSNDNN